MDKNSKEYKALQKSWYDKLKADGFDDIEQDEDHLKRWSAHRAREVYDPQKTPAIEEYYRLAGQFANDYAFSSPQEKVIWEMHANGMSVREIAKALRTDKNKANKDNINKIIQKLTQEMIIKCR